MTSGPAGANALPPWVAWRHQGVRDGFEVVRLAHDSGGLRAVGHTTAVQDGAAWAVAYEIELDREWCTRRALVRIEDRRGSRAVTLTGAGGRWQVDGRDVPEVDGCLDVDLEASAFTNALPLRRHDLAPGQSLSAAAVFVAADGAVTRLEQTYRRLPDRDGGRRYDYEAPVFDFRAVLSYDDLGLIVDYPGLATRVSR